MLRWLFKGEVEEGVQQPSNLRSFGREAVVQSAIRPGVWRVRYRGSFWTARCGETVWLEKGDWVYVVDVQGIDLIVEPASDDDEQAASKEACSTRNNVVSERQ